MFMCSSRQNVSLTVAKVRQSLSARFVPGNIGLRAITRQNYIERQVSDFANELHNETPNVPKAIAYVDGTYSYIPKVQTLVLAAILLRV